VQVVCQDDRPVEDAEKEHMDATFKFILGINLLSITLLSN